MEKQYRSAHFVPESVDRENLTAHVVWGTSAAVERRGYREVLSFERDHVNLERLNAGAPLLMGHKADGQIGVVERAWIEEGEGNVLIRFSKRPEVKVVFDDVADGILRNVSVGYVVKKLEKEDSDTKTFRATDWEPFEISLVPIPADHKAQIREYYEETKNISFEILSEEKDHKRDALVDELLARHDESYKPKRPISYKPIIELVRGYVGDSRGGVQELVSRAFHSTSDFPEVLGEVCQKRLMLSFEKIKNQQNWLPLARIRSVPDFKPVRSIQVGSLPDLEKMPEGSEYSSGTFGEIADSYKIDTYGKMLSITRQAVVNDEFNMILDHMSDWAQSIVRLENRLFWRVFNENPQMVDGHKIFSKNHQNRPQDSGGLNLESLSLARIAMSRQQGIEKRDGEYLDLIPEYLIVPPELLTKAQQIVSREVLAHEPVAVNPFRGEFQIISTPLLRDPCGWFLATSAAAFPCIEMAYLNGIRKPFVEWKTDFATDSVAVKVRFDMGCKVTSCKGLYQGGFSR